MATGAELFSQFDSGRLGAHEDDGGVDVLRLQNARQGIELVQAGDLPVALAHGFDRARFGADSNLDR